MLSCESSNEPSQAHINVVVRIILGAPKLMVSHLTVNIRLRVAPYNAVKNPHGVQLTALFF